MKKIGLYLDSVVGGGVYQYNLSILNAVMDLSNNGLDTIIAYSNNGWVEYLNQNQIKSKKSHILYSVKFGSKLIVHFLYGEN